MTFPAEPLPARRHEQVRTLLVHEAADARTVRKNRPPVRILVGAPLAVGAVVVGIGLATGGTPGDTAVTPAALPTPTPTPTPTKNPKGVAYDIPDWVGFTKAELPSDQKSSGDNDSQYADTLTVDGQLCDHDGAAGPRPIAGRWWSWWAGNGTTQLHARTVDLVVTGWKPGTGAANLRDVAHNAGYCIFNDPVSTENGVTVPGAEHTYAGTSTVNGLHYGYVVVQVGDLLGAVTVQDHHGTAAALTTAERLAGIAAKDLKKVSQPAG